LTFNTVALREKKIGEANQEFRAKAQKTQRRAKITFSHLDISWQAFHNLALPIKSAFLSQTLCDIKLNIYADKIDRANAGWQILPG
jgi:hypothetical protein